ncbi:ribosome silencing factor [Desulfurispirillum indicum]|uniref:Ribosomal silencing factor RsfS n=1 Tax=Desulfurispirillum indicum (strain ATCC BAA-1389 / DSM 22839 / S5) TaxID=653733 RepID=E6W3S5_DESIS|nr:ribosome silencing factor [Desulfurispirillum indicum]ADU66956.1 iojap-like protein [Desulfurispirillum indicum S5]UCZ56337.1 ribosome silencing factor [Desulfurispirillum indicum]
MKSSELLERIHQLADEKHAADVKALELAGVSSFADYFYICTAQSARQAQAIADHIRETVKKEAGVSVLGAEGYDTGEWVLLDFGDIIVHIFSPQLREYYRLESLWEGAPEVNFEVSSSEHRQDPQ